MSKRYTGQYIVRWTDATGKENRKTYTDYQTTIKARDWLIKSGAVDVDIAVEISTAKPQE
jgi:hypothetical protein